MAPFFSWALLLHYVLWAIVPIPGATRTPRVTVPNALCGLESFNRFLRNTSFRYTKPRLCVHWRSKSLSLQPGTDRFTTQSFDFLSFWIRETNCSVHGTDPFATQNANFLNLYFRNRLTGSTEPIDLLHKASTSSVSASENRFIRFTEPIRLLHRTQNS